MFGIFLATTRSTKKITQSLSDGKFELFSILNNGVTVVAASLTPAGNRFTLRDYQIVNGCQTAHVLRDAFKLEGVDRVSVPIKIIVTDSDDIKNEVTIATNSQTEVKAEQLAALTRFQKKLEMYYSAVKEPVQLYYERRSKQFSADPAIRKTQVITIPVQIKVFASAYLNVPHSVSGYYGTIAKTFSGKIFAEDHQLSPYYASALGLYRLETFFRNGQIDTTFKNLRFQILMLARILACGIDVAPFNSRQLERDTQGFIDLLKTEESALKLLNSSLDVAKSSGIDLSKRQFKSESETDLLLQAIRAVV